MKLRIQWKLMASYLLLVILLGGAVYGYLNYSLTAYLTDGIRQNLFNEARLARLMARSEIKDLHRDSPAAAVAIGKEIKARVTIIASNGKVVGDSEVRQEDLKELENHLNRPEVQLALKQGDGSAIRYSSTLRTDMLYVALTIDEQDGNAGILRLALPLSALKDTMTNLHTILAVAMAGAIILSILLSYLFSTVTSRTLRTMTATALQIGRGEFNRRIPVRTSDELGELARVMNDMTGKIEEQVENISAERNRLQAILRGMGEGLMVTDATGVITLVNPAFQGIFGLSNAVEGRQLIDITRHPGLNEVFKEVLASGKEQMEEISLRTQEEKNILTHWVPLMDNGRMQGIVAVFHDITDLIRLERVRRDFVANVSHELRTPVTVIKGYAETLLGEDLTKAPPEIAKFLEIIHNHAGRLAHLISDLLTLSELESRDLALSLAPTSLASTVKHSCTLLEQKALEKSISVNLAEMENFPQVMADRGRLEQVLINLLDNAIKYTPNKGTIDVSAADEGDMLSITVKDSGMGIPERDLPRIFERFYRVDSARSREQGGTGLGLAIVKHIVQLHGGTIGVTSEPGKGAAFTFTLRKANA